jgi:hypothetical protein
MKGYLELSSLIGAHHELAIFRTFGALNAQNIIYLQAELSHLEDEWREIVREDKTCSISSREAYNYDWKKLSRSISARGEDPLQWAKFLEVRKKLTEYSRPRKLQRMTQQLKLWVSRHSTMPILNAAEA